MYHKIVNKFDVDCLEASITMGRLMKDIPAEVKEKIMGATRETVSILDEYYGETRNPESNLGGFLMFLPTVQDTEMFYDKILKHYSIEVAYAEADEEVAASGDIRFRRQTFLLSSDYGIIIVYPEQ
jgi:hypothetical protein